MYSISPKNMHTVFALLCFVVVIHWLIFPYPSGLLHWHCGNLTIAPVPAKQPWWIWINTLCECIMNDCITTTKQCTTKPCAYFVGYTVFCIYPIHVAVHKQGTATVLQRILSSSVNMTTSELCMSWTVHRRVSPLIPYSLREGCPSNAIQHNRMSLLHTDTPAVRIISSYGSRRSKLKNMEHLSSESSSN